MVTGITAGCGQPLGLGIPLKKGGRRSLQPWPSSSPLRRKAPCDARLGERKSTRRCRRFAASLLFPRLTSPCRRYDYYSALENCKREFNGLGAEMNQQYRSDAIFLDDEIAPPALQVGDPALVHTVSTYPGSRLPHVSLLSRTHSLGARTPSADAAILRRLGCRLRYPRRASRRTIWLAKVLSPSSQGSEGMPGYLQLLRYLKGSV